MLCGDGRRPGAPRYAAYLLAMRADVLRGLVANPRLADQRRREVRERIGWGTACEPGARGRISRAALLWLGCTASWQL